MQLTGQIALVTGAGDGIGRAGALALAAAGCSLIVSDIDADAAMSTVTSIQERGGVAVAVPCDVTDATAFEALATAAIDAFGQVDIVWSHVGTSLAGPPELIDLHHWARLFDVNVLSGIRAVQTFLPAMRLRGHGHFVVTSSGLGLFPQDIPGLGAPYVVTKAAQIALARTLQPYLAESGVGMTVLVPDITNTAHTFGTPTIGLDPAVVTANLPIADMQEPDDVARLLVAGLEADDFLVSTVPNTRERLVADAGALFAPSAGAGATARVVQSVRLVADPAKHDELAELLLAGEASMLSEPGALSYRATADLVDRGVFHLLEEWASEADLERHAATPAAEATLTLMPAFGIERLEVRRYATYDVNDSTVEAPPAHDTAPTPEIPKAGLR